MLTLFNTLGRKKQSFHPRSQRLVTMYTCGPTVYSFAHVGNLRTFIFEDILKRTLILNGYQVKHVMNITDVGHLTSNADKGDDKIEKEAQKEHKTAWEIAKFYTKQFFQDCKDLNIIPPTITAKATDHISEDIALIQTLEKKGFTYKTSDGIYFDTSRLPHYGQLTGMSFSQLNKNLKAGARIKLSPEKKNITDFALWKFSPKDKQRQMEWPSPWGIGFPGWHIECSVINLKYLAHAFRGKKFYPKAAQTIDIHCGGIDLIPIHHTNEIAQAEAATDVPFVKYWLHGAFLNLPEGRMGKSKGNTILVKDIIEKGLSPLSFRYLVINSHYRQPLEFSWEALNNAQSSLEKLRSFVWDCLKDKKYNKRKINRAFALSLFKEEFKSAINNDLNTPQALAILWQLIDQYNQTKKHPTQAKLLSPMQIYNLIMEFDKVLGLDLKSVKIKPIPPSIKELAKRRELLRAKKDWKKADKIRNSIAQKGYLLEDTPKGIIIKPTKI